MEHSAVPSLLRPLSTDEYSPPARTSLQRQATALVADLGADSARRSGVELVAYAASRRGTAAGLLSLNQAAGATYFEVPPDAAVDEAAAEDLFAADGPVIDVQTHWMAQRPSLHAAQDRLLRLYRWFAPDWWDGLDGVVAYSLAEYLRCVFVESETAVAVITAAPGNAEGDMMLRNDEMAGMRELFDRMAGTGRLLNHTVVRPNQGEIEHMAAWAEAYDPIGWKVYTLGRMDEEHESFIPGSGWRLDDDTGLAFLGEAQRLGISLVCAHKGVSGLVDCSAPDDVGPAARAFPDIDFLIYHSGYEPGRLEGPYAEDGPTLGIDTLIRSVTDHGLGPGDNVYAELGTTWFNLLSRPEEAGHALGKLLLQLGEDNIIWGTDGIWYGPTQPAIDAFRAFQIPDHLCERYGYPKLTPSARRKILCDNATRVYGLDPGTLGAGASDDLAWVDAVLAEHGRHGLVHRSGD
ncbi:MAG TPA: amidohydrolase family protein [Acidimicrobiales bacterium]